MDVAGLRLGQALQAPRAATRRERTGRGRAPVPRVGGSVTDIADNYFARAEGTPDAPGRFVSVEADTPRVEFLEGLAFNPVVGQQVMANFVRFAPHTEA